MRHSIMEVDALAETDRIVAVDDRSLDNPSPDSNLAVVLSKYFVFRISNHMAVATLDVFKHKVSTFFSNRIVQLTFHRPCYMWM